MAIMKCDDNIRMNWHKSQPEDEPKETIHFLPLNDDVQNDNWGREEFHWITVVPNGLC